MLMISVAKTISSLLTIGLASSLVFAYSNYYSVSTNSIDDGTKSVTKIESKILNSAIHLEPEVDRRILIGPSKWQLPNTQALTNKVPDALAKFEKQRPFFQQKIDGKLRNRGFLKSKARTVESPALSVDSGGRATGGSVGLEIAKLFNLKQGHHASFYDQIDWPNKTQMSTKRPADAIEEGVRSAVMRMFSEQQQQQQQQQHH